jgi:YbbR domain-containing protein
MTLRDLVLHNFWMKFLSVILATVIWFSIRFWDQAELNLPQSPFNQLVQRDYRVPVQILTQPGDARVFKATPEKIVVITTGEDAVLRNYSWKNFRAYVDMTEIHANEPTTQEVKVHSPAGLTVLNFAPRAVNVERISP